MKKFLVLIVGAMFLFISHAEATPVTFYTNAADWLAAVNNVEIFVTNTDNIAKANEVSSPPSNNAQLGNCLTLDAVNTGLSISFNVEALESGANLVFNDEEGAPVNPWWENALSIGDINNHENDDWEINILSGPSLMGFAFDLRDNHSGVDDVFSIYSNGDILLGEMTNIPTNVGGSTFLGVTATKPITRIHFNDDSGGDDIGIANFGFAPVPEPSTWLLLLFGMLGIIGIKKKFSLE